MRQKDRKLLTSLLGVQSKTRDQGRMIDFMHAHLLELGVEVIERDGQLYGRRGNPDIPVPYFVAHADTVHQIVPDEHYRVSTYMTTDGDIIHRAIDPTNGQPRGVGGDDKCGLFACLIAAEEMEDVGIFIARDEESGCSGSRLAIEELFVRPGCFIQLDRRGNSDAVYDIMGPIGSDEWHEAMTPVITDFGYKWTYGAISDVGELCPDMLLSGVNLSAGYHAPHSVNEWVSETDLEMAIELAITIARRAGNDVWPMTAEHVRHGGGFPKGGYKRWNNKTRSYEDYGWDDWDDDRYNYSYTPTSTSTMGKASAGGRKVTPADLLQSNEPSEYSGTLAKYGIQTWYESDRGELYEHYVEVLGSTEKVSVVVDNPIDWEFDDQILIDQITDQMEKDIGEAILRHWHKTIEPLLDAEYGDDVRSLEDNVKFLMEHKDRESLCDHDGCENKWYSYDISTRRYLCALHYEALAEDPQTIRDQVEKVALVVHGARATSRMKRKVIDVAAKDITNGPAGPLGNVMTTPEAAPVVA